MIKKWHEKWLLIEDNKKDEWGVKDLHLLSPIFQVTKNGEHIPVVGRISLCDTDFKYDFPFLLLEFFDQKIIKKHKSHKSFFADKTHRIKTDSRLESDFIFEYGGKHVQVEGYVSYSQCRIPIKIFELLETSAQHSNGDDFINIEMKMDEKGISSILKAQISTLNLKESLPILSEINSKIKMKNENKEN